jgi:glutathione peroxidase-family protein
VNLSNKRGSWKVASVMLGGMVGGLAATGSPVRAQGSSAPTAQSAVPLAEVADVARLEKIVKAAQGKVVLVNFWAAWNEPSIAQYPGFVFLYDHYHAQGLEVISVATDPVNEREAHVIPFIEAYKTKFPTYLKAEGDPVAFLHAVDTSWTGNLPRTYLIGRDGKVRKVYTIQLVERSFEPTIQRLLKEDAPKPKPAKNGKSEDTTPAHNPKGFLGG